MLGDAGGEIALESVQSAAGGRAVAGGRTLLVGQRGIAALALIATLILVTTLVGVAAARRVALVLGARRGPGLLACFGPPTEGKSV